MNFLKTFSQWKTDEIEDYWECPLCKKNYRLDSEQIDFSWNVKGGDDEGLGGSLLLSVTCWCPECVEPAIYLAEYVGYNFFDYEPTYTGHEAELYIRRLFPISNSKEYPDYIPEPIRMDYKEAALIAELSPKASATLARRCLQGMLLDKWKVNKDKSLYNQIDEIKGKIPQKNFSAISVIRKVGNIGAHMKNPNISAIDDSPISSTDARALISLLEVLLKAWYTDPAEEEELMDNMIALGSNLTR